MKEFYKRVITAAVLLSILIYAWLTGGIFLDLCFILMGVIGSWEFYRMFFGKRRQKLLYFGMFLPVLFMGLTLFTPIDDFLALALVGILIAIVTLFRWPQDDKKALREAVILIAGVVYLPVIILLFDRLSPHGILYAFLLPAVNDTFAYLTGLSIGKNKVWVAVSPKKSREGCIGGLVASVIFSVYYCGLYADAHWILFALMGAILSVVAQLGDFFESALKRSADIKDSSSILPGHGGVLDRLDSILFVVPILLILFNLFPQIKF